MDRKSMERLFEEHGCGDFKFFDPRDIVTGQWVRMKCRFGCHHYGKGALCPPNAPSVAECREFFGEYGEAVIFHFSRRLDDPEQRHEWSRSINRILQKVERAVFLSGKYRAFMMFIDPCNFCEECVGPGGDCREPRAARPSPEGLAVDVFSTARKCGYDIQVLKEYTDEMNRFAILLVE
ncbi:MAG: DUF2284 domain-containing protein [Candidatus Krumholzibacteria bacterium]|nr:DUF2284 domain-containing protein [Candidatus Krumholzibacteria bacterium]